MELEYKSIDVAEFKFDDASHGGNGGFTGYASVFNNVDSYKDIVRPGAYTKTLGGFIRDGWLAIAHEWGKLGVGFFTDAKEDSHGLLVGAAFHSTKEAQDARTVVRERLANGKTVGTSIGYLVPEGGRTDNDDGTKNLLNIDLREVSIVTAPANTLALIGAVKSGPHGGLRFVDHSSAVLAALEEFVARAKSIADLRTQAKEGRVLSSATRSRVTSCGESVEEAISALQDVHADLADLLAATLPAPKSDPEPDALAATRQVYAEYLRSLSA